MDKISFLFEILTVKIYLTGLPSPMNKGASMLPFVSESDKEVLKQLALDRTGKDFNLYYKVRNNVYNFCKCIFIAKMMDGGYDMNFYAGTVLN